MNWIKHEKQIINLNNVNVITLVDDYIVILFCDGSSLDLVFLDDCESIDFFVMLLKKVIDYD